MLRNVACHRADLAREVFDGLLSAADYEDSGFMEQASLGSFSTASRSHWPQTASRLIFERLSKRRGPQEEAAFDPVILKGDQENALRYAAGFVPFKLLKKHKKQDTEAAASIVDCLSGMAVQGDESSFLEYTMQWIKAVNRGGLFEVSDSCFQFFRSMEIEMRRAMKEHIEGSTVKSEAIISSISSNPFVLFYWDNLTGTLSEKSKKS